MAVAHPVQRRAFPYFKWTVFGLLGINADGAPAPVAASPAAGQASGEV